MPLDRFPVGGQLSSPWKIGRLEDWKKIKGEGARSPACRNLAAASSTSGFHSRLPAARRMECSYLALPCCNGVRGQASREVVGRRRGGGARGAAQSRCLLPGCWAASHCGGRPQLEQQHARTPPSDARAPAGLAPGHCHTRGPALPLTLMSRLCLMLVWLSGSAGSCSACSARGGRGGGGGGGEAGERRQNGVSVLECRCLSASRATPAGRWGGRLMRVAHPHTTHTHRGLHRLDLLGLVLLAHVRHRLADVAVRSLEEGVGSLRGGRKPQVSC